MEWNDEAIACIKQLWAEGLSTAEIGRRMGVTKNAVVGKAHRLELIARPSPIRRDGRTARPPRRPPGPPRVMGPTLPSMEAVATAPRHAPPPAQAQARPEPVAVRPVAVRPVQVQPVAAPRRSSRLITCCWPIGEPGTRSFRFCDGDAMSGKPYCSEHAQLAYVRVRDRREEVA